MTFSREVRSTLAELHPPESGLSPCLTSNVNPAVVYIESLGSAVSKAGMISPLNRAATILQPALAGQSLAWRHFDWRQINAPLVRGVMAKIEGSPATRNKALAALKGVARACWEMTILNSEDFQRIKSIKQDGGSRELSGRFLPDEEIGRLIHACAIDNTACGVRDAALFTLAAAVGFRRAELASLRVESVHEIAQNEMLSIKLIGKRNKERIVYVSGNSERALTDWLHVRGNVPGPIFCMIRKGGTILPARQVTPMALDLVLRKRNREAGLSKLSFHDFRRTNASNLLDSGADIAIVAKLLGHSNVQTTAKYDRRGERAKMKAAELANVPYYKPSFQKS